MAYQQSTYQGDSEYPINCTGDAVTGDHVRFERAVFTGSFKSPKFSHFEIVTGKIVADSYGAEKQQHTFTLELPNGSKTKIKGRNLYSNGVWRKKWESEEDRNLAADEKHERGGRARSARQARVNESMSAYGY